MLNCNFKVCMHHDQIWSFLLFVKLCLGLNSSYICKLKCMIITSWRLGTNRLASCGLGSPCSALWMCQEFSHHEIVIVCFVKVSSFVVTKAKLCRKIEIFCGTKTYCNRKKPIMFKLSKKYLNIQFILYLFIYIS